MSLLGMARRLLKSRFWLLLLALLGACSLPLNTAVRDWSRMAGIAVTRPGIAAPEAADAARAMQQALSVYFYALGVLWDGVELPFDEAQFAALTPRVPDPAASQAIVELGRVLRAASDEKPPRWLPRDNSGPTPAYEDRRLTNIIRAADGPVRLLLVALSGTVNVTAPPPARNGDGASDPALLQILLEREAQQARLVEDQRKASAQYVAVLDRIAEGHGVLAARAGEIMQRSTELQLRVAEDRLQRIMNDRRALPTP